VWVTNTTASSPFEILNGSSRKYDSLRGKYISAYIESLRICHRRSALETFLKWVYTSKRDLPSYFDATCSALASGGPPAKTHTQDCLLFRDGGGSSSSLSSSIASVGFLRTTKRQANSAFADVIIHELLLLSNNNGSSNKKSADAKKVVESHLKPAYACFLRLHCSPDDIQKSRAWKYGQGAIREADALIQAYFALGEEEKKTESSSLSSGDHHHLNHWSGGAQKSVVLQAALEKCRLLFPSLSGSFFSKKASTKPKTNEDTDADADPNAAPAPGAGKRKLGGEMTKVSFEVSVPQELGAGDTFLTSVKVGGGEQTKKVKLTVPAGNPSTLRFSLNVPKVVVSEKTTKKVRLNVD
jgi:hypothetical protein